MCFSPVPFLHIPPSKNVLTFWLSTSQLPKVLRECQFFSILTCKCASRHSGVPFFHSSTFKSGPNPSDFVHFYLKCASRHSGVQCFLSALSSYLRTRRFSEPTFRPSRPTNQRKNTAFRDFPNISRVWIFFLLTFAHCIFFLLILLLFSAFHLLTLLLCSAFSTVHIVGS